MYYIVLFLITVALPFGFGYVSALPLVHDPSSFTILEIFLVPVVIFFCTAATFGLLVRPQPQYASYDFPSLTFRWYRSVGAGTGIVALAGFLFGLNCAPGTEWVFLTGGMGYLFLGVRAK